MRFTNLHNEHGISVRNHAEQQDELCSLFPVSVGREVPGWIMVSDHEGFEWLRLRYRRGKPSNEERELSVCQ